MGFYINKLSNFLNTIARYICITVLLFLTIITFLGVFWRFILNNPIVWLYEISLILFSWLIFVGMSMAFKTQEHIRLNFLEDIFSNNTKWIWKEMLYAISLVFCIIGIVAGLQVTMNTWGQTYNTVPIPKGIFYISFPIGALFSSVHLLDHMIHFKNEKSEKEGDIIS